MTELAPDASSGSIEPPFPLSADEARAFVASFPFWYHNIYLGNGVFTMAGRGHHQDVWDLFDKALPQDLAGRAVLDIGTNAGYFALQSKLRSAGRVVGTEFLEIYLRQANAIKKIWGVDIDYRLMDAHQLPELRQRFDLVAFAGILYHLKNPLQVLEDIGNMCDDAILLETEAIPDDPLNNLIVRQGVPPVLQPMNKGFMKFIEKTELNDDPSNWWVPDTECVMGMLRTAGFVHISRPVMLHGTRLIMVASKKRNSLLDIDAFGR